MSDYITRGEVQRFLSITPENPTLQDFLSAAAKVWPDRTYDEIMYELEAALPPRITDE